MADGADAEDRQLWNLGALAKGSTARTGTPIETTREVLAPGRPSKRADLDFKQG